MLNAPMFITLITFAQLQHPRFNNPIFPTLKDEQVIPEHGLQQLNKQPRLHTEHGFRHAPASPRLKQETQFAHEVPKLIPDRQSAIGPQ